MFKKKPDIPPRPRIPTVEQILEDIENSSYDDVVFEKSGKSPTSELTASPNSAEETYRKVKHFEDISAVLKSMLDKLQDQSEALKVSDMELRAMADEIRKQALQALK